MPTSAREHVLIVGAGLAGALLAHRLGVMGYRVSVYERRADPRVRGYAGGRSINLALSARGIDALRRAGLEQRVLAHAIPMRGRMLHPRDGPLAFQPYSKDTGDAINSISRAGLNLVLIEAAADVPGVAFHFDHRCVDVDLARCDAVFDTPSGASRVRADIIIGADGAFSAVRQRLEREDRFEYSQSYLEHGYKELHIPPGPGGTFAMEPNALHIWPRKSAMMIALPNADASFTCTLFWPFEGEHSFERLKTRADAEEFFRREYPDAPALMPTLADDFLKNPTSSLVTVRCRPWCWGGKVALLGDAAHAIVPFYGQGMNCAFEDVSVLCDEVRAHAGDWNAALREYELTRKPNADAIAEMALENFVEMRDKVGSPAFRAQKRLEQTVHDLFPGELTPQYNLVSFSTVPYTRARAAGRRFDAILDALAHLAEPGPDLSAWREQVKGAVEHVRAGASRRRVWDLSPRIDASLKVWPADTPPSREVVLDIARGDPVTLSTLRTTVHAGAHADAPNHYGRGAPGVERMPLEHYLGECQVISARVERGARVRVRDLAAEPRRPRVLIRTRTFPDPTRFDTDFAALDPDLVRAFHDQGVLTIGIDTPSVDLFNSKDLPAHAAFLARSMAILEGLVLEGVDDGEYELIALPLPLVGFDASPVRAVLRELASG